VNEDDASKLKNTNRNTPILVGGGEAYGGMASNVALAGWSMLVGVGS
jgi:hypothetical protein